MLFGDPFVGLGEVFGDVLGGFVLDEELFVFDVWGEVWGEIADGEDCVDGVGEQVLGVLRELEGAQEQAGGVLAGVQDHRNVFGLVEHLRNYSEGLGNRNILWKTDPY